MNDIPDDYVPIGFASDVGQEQIVSDDRMKLHRSADPIPSAEPAPRVTHTDYQPHNIQAEAALLGALMIDNALIDEIRTKLKMGDFFEEVHGRIYQAIIVLSDKGSAANPITLRPYFERDTTLKQLGGSAYLAQLTGNSAALIGARDFANQVLELSQMRALLVVANDARAALQDTSNFDPLSDIVANIDRALSETMIQPESMRTVSLGKAWDEAFAEMEAAERGEEQSGILIKQYEDWNTICGRMDAGDLIYLAARPSMGKSAVAFAVAVGAAAAGNATEIFSLEMNRRRVLNRIIANQIFTPERTSNYKNLTEGKLTKVDRAAIERMRAQIDEWPIHISDPDTMKVENVASAIRRRQRYWSARGKELKLVVIDYLGRLDTIAKFNSQNDRVTHISKTLKAAARQCGVALIVLCQLSRGLEQREDKRPVLADLRDSGSLEQDGDVVVFVYREEYYLRGAEPPAANQDKWGKWDIDMQAARNRMELYSAKRREGALVKRTGWFFTDHQALRPSDYRYGEDLFNRSDRDGPAF
jgi:replicative DNA helicase